MRIIEAPQGSYRFRIPEEPFDQVMIVDSPAKLDILPSDALIDWMADKNIKCELKATWETNDLHFNLAAELVFQSDNDAIMFKLTWVEI
jgi:hypothetical protein